MKFFEFAQAIAPLVPGSLPRAPFMRELISMLTSIKESEWGTRKDPEEFPSDTTLESMFSRDTAFTKKFANSLNSRLNTANFIYLIKELDPAAKQQIVDNFDGYGMQVRLDDLAHDVTNVLVDIIRVKAKITTDDAQLRAKIRIEATQAKFTEELLVRSRGCQLCGHSLVTQSGKASKASYEIVPLDLNEVLEPADFAVLCKPCGEKFKLSHTDDQVTQMREANRKMMELQNVSDNLAPFGLDKKITALLRKIRSLPRAERVGDLNYSAIPLEQKLDDEGLIDRCVDATVVYKRFIDQQSNVLEVSGELDFGRMCHQVKSAWYEMHDSGLHQDDVFLRLTNWMVDHTVSEHHACGVLIAYLTQICELFTRKVGAA